MLNGSVAPTCAHAPRLEEQGGRSWGQEPSRGQTRALFLAQSSPSRSAAMCRTEIGLYQHICRRLKTEILKAVHTVELDLYPLPPPLFNDSKLKYSALGLTCHSSGTLMTPIQCRDIWTE